MAESVPIVAMAVLLGAGLVVGYVRWPYLLIPAVLGALTATGLGLIWWDIRDCNDFESTWITCRELAWVGTVIVFVLAFVAWLFASLGWAIGRLMRDGIR
jgi:hypothetical protein